MENFETPPSPTRVERRAARRVGRDARRRFFWGSVLLAVLAAAALILLYVSGPS